MHIHSNFNNAFVACINSLKQKPELVGPKGKSKETCGYTFILSNPLYCFINLPSRNLKIDYPINEFAWYMTGDKNVQDIGKFASIWNKIKDNNGEVESNYGKYIWYDEIKNEGSQWDWCIKELCYEENSRRAILNILQPYHKYKNENDIPCTESIQFFVRDNKLNCIVNMRSCDVIYGLCNDIFCFSLIQQCMLNELNDYISIKNNLNEKSDEIDFSHIPVYPNLEFNKKPKQKLEKIQLGYLQMNIGSLHIYEKHYKFLEKNWFYENQGNVYEIKLKDGFLISERLPINGFKNSVEILKSNVDITLIKQELY